MGQKPVTSYLALAANGGSLSWTANGVSIPAERSSIKLYQKLFVNGTPAQIKEQMKELERGRSILDTVMSPTKKLERNLSGKDKEKLDEYLSSIRSLEIRLEQSKAWAQRPKPKVDFEVKREPAKLDIIAKQALMYDLMALAIQTDSCRVFTLTLGSLNAVPENLPGVKSDWHNLSHHGKDQAKIDELKIVEEAEFKILNNFLTKLKNSKENGKPLLDQTAVLFGSNLGNASSHSWKNLPIIVAGGGFKHGNYIASR